MSKIKTYQCNGIIETNHYEVDGWGYAGNTHNCNEVAKLQCDLCELRYCGNTPHTVMKYFDSDKEICCSCLEKVKKQTYKLNKNLNLKSLDLLFKEKMEKQKV